MSEDEIETGEAILMRCWLDGRLGGWCSGVDVSKWLVMHTKSVDGLLEG